jgi:hypothetical protein
VDQVDEFRYATEFDPPGRSIVTKSVKPVGESEADGAAENQNPKGPSTILETTAGTENKDAGAPVPETEGSDVVETTTNVHYGTPTAFETRNVGVMLEIEPVLGPDGRTIDISLVPQHVRFLGMRKAIVEHTGTEDKVIVEQPEFLTNKVTTSIQVVDGEHTLLGVFKVNDPPGTVELFILHTQLKKIEVPVGRAKTIISPGDQQSAGGAGLGP